MELSQDPSHTLRFCTRRVNCRVLSLFCFFLFSSFFILLFVPHDDTTYSRLIILTWPFALECWLAEIATHDTRVHNDVTEQTQRAIHVRRAGSRFFLHARDLMICNMYLNVMITDLMVPIILPTPPTSLSLSLFNDNWRSQVVAEDFTFIADFRFPAKYSAIVREIQLRRTERNYLARHCDIFPGEFARLVCQSERKSSLRRM